MDELAQSAMDAVTDGRVQDHSRALRQGLSRLAQREARLADQPAALVGTSDSGLVLRTTASRRRELQAGVRRPTSDVVWQRDDELRPVARICARGRATWPNDAMLEPQATSQESDVLDTWFSSALWPHSTLGWPEQTPELKYYYPTSVLITSRDIITLWVARMVLTGPAQRGRGAVPRRLHPPEDSRRLRRGDVEVEGQRRRSDRRDREVRGRLAALRPGLSDDRDAGRAHAGRVRVPALPEADRADQGEPHPAADQVQAVRQGVFHAMGREAGRQGPAARGGGERPLRAGPQLLQQALERLAVRADEPRRLHAGPGGRRRAAGRGLAGS